MKKILYFEGAGWVEYNGVNCRIRTAFTNTEGKKIYIEFLCGHIYGKKNKKEPEFNYLVCDYCHYITDDETIDDCNYSTLPCERSTGRGQIEYTKENILTFVNKNCNADFEEIVVLDNLAGFRVFSDKPRKGYGTSEQYNFGDVFNYDAEMTEKRIAKVKEMKKEFCILFNQKYDNTSYWTDKDGNLTVRIGVSDETLKKANWTKGRQFTVEV